MGSIVYELDQATSVVFLQRDSDAGTLLSQVHEYDDPWLFSSFNPATANIRGELESRLARSDEYHSLPWDPKKRATWGGPILHYRKSRPGERRG